MNNNEDFSSKLLTLEKRLDVLEEMLGRTSAFAKHLRKDSSSYDSSSEILKRINNVQYLVDQVEIEIDKLEMRISAIEHMSFKLRTDGQ